MTPSGSKVYPNTGYEPYWEDGNWVFETTTEEKDFLVLGTTTTPKPTKVCGQECGYIKGPACAIQPSNYLYLYRTFYNLYKEYPDYDIAKGKYILPNKGTTFESLCAYLERSCNDKSWVFLAMGNCTVPLYS